MKTAEEIVKALRCSSTIHLEGGETDCKNCPYWFHIKPSEDMKRWFADKSDDFWYMCDYERICMDAAELIERLVNDKSTV